MARYTEPVSVLVTPDQKRSIRDVVETDRAHGRVSEADVVRAALSIGLASLDRKTWRDRLRLYAVL